MYFILSRMTTSKTWRRMWVLMKVSQKKLFYRIRRGWWAFEDECVISFELLCVFHLKLEYRLLYYMQTWFVKTSIFKLLYLEGQFYIINAKSCLPSYFSSRQWNSEAHFIKVLGYFNCSSCLRSASLWWVLVQGVTDCGRWERSCDSGKERLSLRLDPLVWKACYNCLCCWGLNAELPPGSIYLHGVCS